MSAERDLTVLVLGAGASKGEKFDGSDRSCSPPLNTDFFTQLQRITKHKHQGVISETIKDIHSLYGKNWALTLEEYFTQIEFFTKSLNFSKRKSRDERLTNSRTNLLQALSAVFEEAIPRDQHEYHNELVKGLKPNDVILSFNYDCLIDYALKEQGAGKWSPIPGYQFPSRRWTVEGEAAWCPGNKQERCDCSIRLMKLHGSLNWHIRETTTSRVIKLKERLHQQKGKVQFSIIPPEWNKSLNESEVFQRLWKEAAKSLGKAKNLVFIGYSFSNNDLHSLALFRLGLIHPLKRVVIVNPSQEARRRTRAAIQEGIGEETIITQFDSLAEFTQSSCMKQFQEATEKVIRDNTASATAVPTAQQTPGTL